MSARPSPAVLLDTRDALLTRTDLAQLGLPEKAVDAVFRALPIVKLHGYSRPFIRASDYRDYIESCVYDERVPRDRLRVVPKG